MKKFLVILGLLVSLPTFAADPLPGGDQDELLEPDQAFSLSTSVVDGNQLEAKWTIADGYYLYRDKFKFDVVKGSATLLTPEFPKGKVKKDPLFGEVETYVKTVSVKLPLKRAGAAAEKLTLRITSQGCNEPVGVCYPPITKEIGFALPAVAAASVQKIDSISALKQLVQPGTDVGQEFLHPDEAFKLSVTAIDDRTLNAHFAIVDGYYLYRDKIKFSLDGAGGSAELGKVKMPKGKTKEDPTFGKTVVYTQSFDVSVPVKISSGDAMAAALSVGYQGCAEKGICYPPTTRKINLAMAGGKVSVGDATEGMSVAGTSAGKSGSTISTRDYWLAILGAFGVGLILTFTPCVLPMIPILSSIIVGQGGQEITKLRGGFLATVYVLGTSVTYTLAGVLAGATGDQLQAYFQNVWAIGIFSTLLALLALSMFGFYEIQMPSFIQSRLQTRSQDIKGGSVIGVFIMGVISALIVGACVSPLLMAALGAAIATKDAVLGGLIMFSMSMGMGAILIGLGFGAGFLLPRAGVWMDRVKYFFGVLLLGVAIYLLGLLPQVPVMYLWAALFIVTAIYLGAIEPLPAGSSGWRYLFKGIGMLLLVWGALALIGAFSGNRDILKPVSLSELTVSTGRSSVAAVSSEIHVFERVNNMAELDARLASAKTAGKPVILDYFATWCTDCIRMEKTTFVDPQVTKVLNERFVALQVEVTDPNNPDTKAIKQRYSVFGPPAMIVLDRNGEIRKDLNFYGYKTPEEFLAVLNQV
ncbi:MAG: protein-disulfide reductase DsbD [Acidiferrobacterales bacterium]|nr:protein-disulfide reductase DsbD [Acidiferrobacterales bacterium]